MDLGSIISTIFKPLGWLFQGDQLIVFVFIILGMVLVAIFTDSGPKKWLAMLAVPITFGLAAKFIAKGRAVRDSKDLAATRKLLVQVKANDEKIRKDLVDVQRIKNDIARLRASDVDRQQEIDLKREKLRKLEEERDRIELDNSTMVAAAERVIERTAETPSHSERLALLMSRIEGANIGVVSSSPPAPTPDPQPLSDRPGIDSNGFTLKGDV